MKRISIDYYFIGLLSAVAALVIFKLPHLSLPYFWDEAWVYAPAVLEMHKNGLSLLPDAIPPELSRGHPLLFHFLAAGWVKIFGTSFIAVHSFALTISVALLISVYFFCKDFFSPLVGLLAALMVAVQPLFLAQSSFLLPEVMMALWTILVLYYYLKEKWIPFIVFASLMLLTKESGIVLLGTIGLWTLFENVFLKKEPLFKPEVVKTYLLLLSPLLVAGVYFGIQKLQHGWFLYPDHIGMMTLDWETFHKKFLDIYGFLLLGQGRYLLYISFFICCSFFWKSLNSIERFIIPAGYLFVIYILFNLWGIDDKLLVLLVLLIFAQLYKLVFLRIYKEEKETGKVLSISALFVFLYFNFSLINFVSLRYFTLFLPIGILVVFGFIYYALKERLWLFTLIAIVCILNCARQISKYDKVGDYNLSYVDAIKAQQKFVHYCEENNWYQSKIYAGFNGEISLNESIKGYRNTSDKFSAITDTLVSDVQFSVFTNIEPRADYDSLMNELNLEHLISFEENKVWIDVYKFNGFVNDSIPHTAVAKRNLKKI